MAIEMKFVISCRIQEQIKKKHRNTILKKKKLRRNILWTLLYPQLTYCTYLIRQNAKSMLRAGYHLNYMEMLQQEIYTYGIKIQYIKINYCIIDIWSRSLKTVAELAQYLLSDYNLKWNSENHLYRKKILWGLECYTLLKYKYCVR